MGNSYPWCAGNSEWSEEQAVIGDEGLVVVHRVDPRKSVLNSFHLGSYTYSRAFGLGETGYLQ